ncbi:MAG: hypothetical protein ACE5H1_01870, partial [Thermodesulfobacteriota bacterium]
MSVSRIRRLVWKYFGDENKVNMWFCMPNHVLGNMMSPNEMIAEGQEMKLLRLVEQQLYIVHTEEGRAIFEGQIQAPQK